MDGSGLSCTLTSVAPSGKPRSFPQEMLDSWRSPDAGGSFKYRALVALGANASEVSGLLLPWQILSVTGEVGINTVATSEALLPVTGKIFTVADYVIGSPDPARAPPTKCDIVIVPALPPRDILLEKWIKEQWDQGAWILSVCEGASVVASSGVLDNGRATTHFFGLDELAESVKSVTFLHGHRYVVSGKVVTSAGVSAGMDATLHLVEELLQSAKDTTERIGYNTWLAEEDPEGDDECDAVFSVTNEERELLKMSEPRKRVAVGLFDGVSEVVLGAVLACLARSGRVEIETFAIDKCQGEAAVELESVETKYGATIVPSKTFDEILREKSELDAVIIASVEEEDEAVGMVQAAAPPECKVTALSGGKEGNAFPASLEVVKELLGLECAELAARMVEVRWSSARS